MSWMSYWIETVIEKNGISMWCWESRFRLCKTARSEQQACEKNVGKNVKPFSWSISQISYKNVAEVLSSESIKYPGCVLFINPLLQAVIVYSYSSLTVTCMGHYF